eukprot:scaffold12862_cov116-Isochrysis_galbana.AAC.9
MSWRCVLSRVAPVRSTHRQKVTIHASAVSLSIERTTSYATSSGCATPSSRLWQAAAAEKRAARAVMSSRVTPPWLRGEAWFCRKRVDSTAALLVACSRSSDSGSRRSDSRAFLAAAAVFSRRSLASACSSVRTTPWAGIRLGDMIWSGTSGGSGIAGSSTIWRLRLLHGGGAMPFSLFRQSAACMIRPDATGISTSG